MGTSTPSPLNNQLPKSRAPRVDLAQRRAAMAVLGPLAASLSEWQRQGALLRGVAERARSGYRTDPHWALDAAAMTADMANHRQKFIEELNGYPPTVARHSRVRDALRALDIVAASTAEARLALEAGAAVSAGSRP